MFVCREADVRRSQGESVEQLVYGQSVMLGDTLQDARQCLGLDRTVHRDHLVMLAVDLGS